MTKTQEALPQNMTRVLAHHANGAIEFALYKDGMFRPDSTRQYIPISEVASWMAIKDLKDLLAI